VALLDNRRDHAEDEDEARRAQAAEAHGVGQLMRAGGWKQHKLEGKSPKRRRRLRKKKLIDRADQARLQVLVPYL